MTAVDRATSPLIVVRHMGHHVRGLDHAGSSDLRGRVVDGVEQRGRSEHRAPFAHAAGSDHVVGLVLQVFELDLWDLPEGIG